MAVYLVSCHDCEHAPYLEDVGTNPAPTSCKYCGSTNIDVVQVA